MTLPTGTLNDSGKLRSPLVPEEVKDHVREENLDVSMVSGAVYLENPWSGSTVL